MKYQKILSHERQVKRTEFKCNITTYCNNSKQTNTQKSSPRPHGTKEVISNLYHHSSLRYPDDLLFGHRFLVCFCWAKTRVAHRCCGRGRLRRLVPTCTAWTWTSFDRGPDSNSMISPVVRGFFYGKKKRCGFLVGKNERVFLGLGKKFWEGFFFLVVVIGTFFNSWGTFHWKTLGETSYKGYISLSSPFLKETISLDALVFYWTIWMKKTPSIFFTTTPSNMTFLLQHQT